VLGYGDGVNPGVGVGGAVDVGSFSDLTDGNGARVRVSGDDGGPTGEEVLFGS
jgi:hypothetical protein